MPYVKETLNVVDLGRPLHAGCFSLPRQRGTFPLVLPSCHNCLPTLPVCSQCALLDLDAKLGSIRPKSGGSGGGPLISGGILAKPKPVAEVLASASQQQRPTPSTICPPNSVSRKGIKARRCCRLGLEKKPEPSLFLWLVKRASQLGSTRCSSLAGSWLDPTTICYIKF